MEEHLCMCFYTILCCILCCPAEERRVVSREPPEYTVVNNPGLESTSGALKDESDIKKDGPTL